MSRRWTELVGKINREVEEVKAQLLQADAAFSKATKENSSLNAAVKDMKGKRRNAEASFG